MGGDFLPCRSPVWSLPHPLSAFDISRAPVGSVFRLAEQIHFLQLCGCPCEKHTYFACVRLSFPFILQERHTSVEPVAPVQTRQHDKMAAGGGRAVWLAQGNRE